VAVLKEIAAVDKRLKIIVNTRNFGHVRSPHHALLQVRGDAAIAMASDLQDPPELIPQLIEQWEAGFKVVFAQKTKSKESPLFRLVRTSYYRLIGRLSEVEMVEHVTGFGLYDQRVIGDLRRLDDPYPYFRGLICDLGYERALVEFVQPTRVRGITKNNFYTLYDLGMLGITNHSKVPLRLAAMLGFAMAALSFLVGFGYLFAKLVFWDRFTLGTAPVVVGLFFFASVQLFFTGIVGEYIGAIHTQVLKRPLVIEAERINFDDEPQASE
jgi:glycosyltransferase involved in cell wall biosynthesis